MNSRAVIIIFGATSLALVGFGVQKASMAVHMQQLGFAASTIGLIMAVYGLPRAAMNLIGGALTDRFPLWFNLGTSIGLLTLAYVMIGWGTTPVPLVLGRVMLAVGTSWMMVAGMNGLLASAAPSTWGRLVGAYRFISGATMAGGAWAVPLLATRMSIQSLLLISFGLGALATLSSFFVKQERGADEPAKNAPPPVAPVAATRTSKAAMNVVGLISKVLEDGLVTTLLPLWLVSMAPDAGRTAVLVISAVTVMLAVSSVPAGWMLDRFGCKLTVLAGGVITLVGTVLAVMSQSIALQYLAGFLLGTGLGTVQMATEILVSRTVPATQRGTAMGAWRTYRDAGSFIGPLLASLPLRMGLLSTAAIALFAIGATLLIPNDRANQPADETLSAEA